MGRHRRSAAGRATAADHTDGSYPEGRSRRDVYGGDHPAMGIAPYLNPEAYAETVARSQEYLFAPDDERVAAGDTAVFASDGFASDRFTSDDFTSDDFAADDFAVDGFTPGRGPAHGAGGRGGAGRRRKRKAVTPVRTGLLGMSAAVALGTVAVATGVVPGLDSYRLGGGGGAEDRVQAADSPTNSASEQGGTSGSAEADRDSTSTSRDAGRDTSPSASAPASATPSPSASKASPSASATIEKPRTTPEKEPEKAPEKAPSKAATKAPVKSSPVTFSAEIQAAAEVLKLVNEERAKVGCSAVSANSSLADLAQRFSEDMAARGFFDHTDPDGATPWDRAGKAGISDLGGENIARGQADAAAVMEAWMNSPGHRANILNCDFKTLGVGVHLGSGGPWWTQNFGY
ncbi:CAP domain-containing protein [Streptomyces sp. NPDC048737]|uniref:CAP domain-containing protein n=1 Tax=unclassified Streptomyces TaxID=2593676 RepID=UPI003424798D